RARHACRTRRPSDLAHGEINPEKTSKQGRVLCLDAGEIKNGKPKIVWKYDGAKIKFGSLLLHEGRLYANDEDAFLHCFDAEKGRSEEHTYELQSLAT